MAKPKAWNALKGALKEADKCAKQVVSLSVTIQDAISFTDCRLT
jgi:hypothetical protein